MLADIAAAIGAVGLCLETARADVGEPVREAKTPGLGFVDVADALTTVRVAMVELMGDSDFYRLDDGGRALQLASKALNHINCGLSELGAVERRMVQS